MNRKAMRRSIILIVLSLFGVTLCAELLTRRHLALYVTEFVVVDAETGERLRVSIGRTGEALRDGKPPPSVTEMPLEGPYRITQVAFEQPRVTLECDGYVPKEVLLDRMDGALTIAGRVPMVTVTMLKAPNQSLQTDG